jgi:DNA-binding GntR family transcriptional regulator
MSSDPYVSKGDVIFESVREMIIRGEMLPGEPLRQRDLAARFNVSPTPVREALQRLESEGLVRSVLHQGSRVAELEDDEQEESYRILATLEPLATGLAMERMTDHDFEEVRRLERAFAERLDDESMATELNRQFHFRIYECARSPLLLSLVLTPPPALAPARSVSQGASTPDRCASCARQRASGSHHSGTRAGQHRLDANDDTQERT